jgi:hypothetical protein
MSLYVRYVPTALGGGGGGGGGGGSTSNGILAAATLYDPVDTTLPTTAPYVIDGVTVTTGMLVLFSNLSSGNNEIYLATVTGSTITWTVQPVFNNVTTPVAGSLVTIAQGTAFGGQIGEFNGTTWLFNYYVRYFNGTNYYEQSSLNIATLADNTTNGTVFSVAEAGSQNIMVTYSIIRGSAKEIGTIPITTNGSTVAISDTGSQTTPTGVTFSAVISSGNLVLQYTTTSTGTAGTMSYYITRWSDTAGGPAGPPSYSGGASAIPAAGSNGNLQINTSGVLGASSNLSYDTVNNLLLLGNEQVSILNSTTFLDNQVSPTPIVTMPATYNAVYFRYTVIRGTAVKVGEIMIATDGAVGIGDAEEYAESPSGGATGVTLSVTLSGGNIVISYTSTSTGSGGTFKYTFDRW